MSDQIKISSDLEDGRWNVSATLGESTILVETHSGDESLPTLAAALPQILDTAWAAIEEQMSQEDS